VATPIHSVGPSESKRFAITRFLHQAINYNAASEQNKTEFSVYLSKENRRQGVFSTLYPHVESLAGARQDVCGLRPYIENKNSGAQETYPALGMSGPVYQVMEIDITNEQERKNA